MREPFLTIGSVLFIALTIKVCNGTPSPNFYFTRPRLRASLPISLAIPNTTSRADSGLVVSLRLVHNNLSSLIEKMVVSTWTILSV